MNVICPNCSTEFSIPDNVYVPGRKARCSVCQHVFPLPDAPGFGAPAAPVAETGPVPPDEDELDSFLDREQGDGPAQAALEEETEDDSFARQQADFDADMNALLGKASEAQSDFVEVGRAERKETTEKPKKGKKKLVFLLLFLILLGGAGYFAYTTFFAGGKTKSVEPGPDVQVSDIAPDTVAKVSKLDLKSSGVKYEYIRNDKLGPILVMQGRVVNHFDGPKDYITVEARLLNSKGEVLKAQKQVCGVMLTPLQLSALGQRELIKALNNRIEIMANNVNVLPGQDVPFMVVFVYPPSSAVEIEVSVVDAADPPSAGTAP